MNQDKIFLSELIPYNNSGDKLYKILKEVKENKNSCYSDVSVEIAKFLIKRYALTLVSKYRYQVSINKKFRDILKNTEVIDADIIKGIYANCRAERLKDLKNIAITTDVFYKEFNNLLKNIYSSIPEYIIVEYKTSDRKSFQQLMISDNNDINDCDKITLLTHLKKYFGIDEMVYPDTLTLKFNEEFIIKRILISQKLYSKIMDSNLSDQSSKELYKIISFIENPSNTRIIMI